MPRKTFLVRGRDDKEYQVTVKKQGHNLSVNCTCPDGKAGRLCSHRMNLIKGSRRGLIRPDFDDLKKLRQWIKGSDVWEALETLRLIEEKADEINEEIRIAKEALEICLND